MAVNGSSINFAQFLASTKKESESQAETQALPTPIQALPSPTQTSGPAAPRVALAYKKPPTDTEIKTAHDQINNFYKQEGDLREQLGSILANSPDAKKITESINQIVNQKDAAINQLANRFEANTPENRALKDMASITQNDAKLNAIDQQLLAINQTKIGYMAQLSLGGSPTSAQQLQKMLEALKTAEANLKALKTKYNDENKSLKADMKSVYSKCKPGVQDIIKDMCTDETNNDKKSNTALEKLFEGIQTKSTEDFTKIEEIKIQALTDPKYLSNPEQQQKVLEGLNQAEKRNLLLMAQTYPSDSPQQNALLSMVKLSDIDIQKTITHQQQTTIDMEISKLDQMLVGLSPDSAEAKDLQNKITMLNQRAENLNQLEESLEKKEKEQIAEYKKNIAASPKGDRAEIQKLFDETLKVDTAQEKHNQEIRDAVSKQLEQLEKGLADALTGQSGNTPYLSNYNETKQRLLTVLESTYPHGSEQREAVESLMKLNNNEAQQFALENRQGQLNHSIAQMEARLKTLDPNSTQAQELKKQLEAGYTLRNTLDEKENTLEADEKKERQKLKEHILKSPKTERKFLADIRNDKLTNEVRIEQHKLTHQTELIQSYENALNNPSIPEDRKEAYRQAIIKEKEKYNELNKEMKVDQAESKFWERIINPPKK